MEQVVGIEPTSSAWKAEVLPLNYTCITLDIYKLYWVFFTLSILFQNFLDICMSYYYENLILALIAVTYVIKSYNPYTNFITILLLNDIYLSFLLLQIHYAYLLSLRIQFHLGGHIHVEYLLL